MLFYGVEHMRALLADDVDDHFLFDPIASCWEANDVMWQELDDVPANKLDGLQTMMEVNLSRAHATAAPACPSITCTARHCKWHHTNRTWARTHTLHVHVGRGWVPCKA